MSDKRKKGIQALSDDNLNQVAGGRGIAIALDNGMVLTGKNAIDFLNDAKAAQKNEALPGEPSQGDMMDELFNS